MPINFPTRMCLPPLFFGEPRVAKKKRDPKYQVVVSRSDDEVVIYIADEWRGYHHKRIPLTRRWFDTSNPTERIRNTKNKLQRKANEMNAREIAMSHEAGLVNAE